VGTLKRGAWLRRGLPAGQDTVAPARPTEVVRAGSLRHVFCTTALFTWKLDVTNVSRMAGRANYRITLDMYVGSTAGVLDRARTAGE
jgi:hypothetical protein